MKDNNFFEETIKELLKIEHKHIAYKLNFVSNDSSDISDSLLYRAINVIDYYSRFEDDNSKQIVVVLSSILYTYKLEHWEGLRQFLVIVLSRIGFAPSAIMIDDKYDFENGQFSSFDSFISELATSVNQLKNEIIIADKKYLLTDFQNKIWEKCKTLNFVGISAPTSAGKSFVILLKAIENIKTLGGNIVYIVPTLSLISQIVYDFHQKLKEFELKDYQILTSYSEQDQLNKIYVLTPERAISAYDQEEEPFGKINTFIVDEIQNIERIDNESDERSKILFDSLVELSFSSQPKLIIFSGPRVQGLKKMGFDIFDSNNNEELITSSSPVTNFTYSVLKKGQKFYFKQYTQLSDEVLQMEIENKEDIKIGGKLYDDKYFRYLSAVLNNYGSNSINVIFSSTPHNARKTALAIEDKLEGIVNIGEEIDSLCDYISITVHPKYDIIKTLKKKIIYHHGKVPIHIRNVLEYAVKEEMIDNIVCTTTLLQGVNLPAQNVIMRNGFLASRTIKGKMPKLTNYEISNLRGRAGRLMKDIIGRTFVLDENAFDEEVKHQTLFQDENKKLQSGYRDIYKKHEFIIDKSLNDSVDSESYPEQISQEAKFLITYIRYTILKHKENSSTRLNSVGIPFNKAETDQIFEDLYNIIAIPLEICFRNRYVDPLLMNKFFEEIDLFDLPSSIQDNDLANKLFRLTKLIKEKYPDFYSKHFNRELPITFFYTVNEWVKEKPLNAILNGPYFNESQNIDNKIEDIQKHICFELIALLKPFYSIKYPDSKFLSCLEMGAYSELTISLINLGIPREVTLILRQTVFPKNINNFSTEYLKNTIKNGWNKINFWNQIQLKHLF